MNNKGFMMAEVVVVSAIVLGLLTTLYISYNKIYSVYNKRISYYDNTTLYRLAYYRDILIENELMNNLITENKNKTKKIYSSKDASNSLFSLPDTEYSENANYKEEVYLTCLSSSKKINQSQVEAQGTNAKINPTFSDYIKFLSDSVTFKANYVLLMERCQKLGANAADDCKYAYLEVYDGSES